MCNANGQFLHLLLFVPDCPIPLMGRNLLTKLDATVSRGAKEPSSFPNSSYRKGQIAFEVEIYLSIQRKELFKGQLLNTVLFS